MEYINNPQLQLAFDFVQFTGTNVFLTGKAGTGKTTFLHNLKHSTFKRMIVVAPTGVAAINAGGVTIHSFFQLPFGPQLPNNQSTNSLSNVNESGNERSRLQRFSRDKINIIRSLDLLVIDEISMVRADLLDGIDGVLRRFKNRNKPFGGVQLLMIGDLQQLAPIAKDDEWSILRQYYDTVFFFSSKALRQTNYISVELKHIFRQSDKVFIELLNKVRNNQLDDESIAMLNQQHIPNFNPADSEGYITLTTHNHQAQSINTRKLKEIDAKPHTFSAVISGDFPEHSYPTDYELTLKEGAQVMFVKNDPSHEKLFFNGKIGTLKYIDDDVLYVECPEDNFPIAVTPLEWDNTKYTINNDTKEIDETVTGSFTQYPLKLAWAITIHKSQGLTFEKAIIDAQAAFTHGQVYVALSRCKSLNGMVLSTPIRTHAIINDNTVTGFNKDIEDNPPTPEQLKKAQLEYQRDLLMELFNFKLAQNQLDQALRFVKANVNSFQPNLPQYLNTISSKLKSDIFDVSAKFTQQIVRLIEEHSMVEDNASLQDRLKKASSYFAPKLQNEILQPLYDIDIETDSKELKGKINESINKVVNELNVKLVCINSCKNGFVTTKFIETKAKASIEEPKKRKKDRAHTKPDTTTVKHPDMYNRLKEWRNKLAQEQNVAVYRIVTQKSLIEIASELPYHKLLLKKVNGMGKKKVEKFGEEIIRMVTAFRAEKGIPIPEGDIFEDAKTEPKKKKKGESHLASFQMFQKGKSISQIAKERELAESTVASHLTRFIKSGDLPVEKLIPKEKLNRIENYFTEAKDLQLTPAKETLGEEFSYNEIRWGLLHLQNKGKVKKE
ncbi:MAG: helix-turn-helix domain-containing protein [Bacteroidales bacterium]